MPRVSHRAASGLLALLVLSGAAGCGEEPPGPLAWAGIRHVEEWTPERVQQRLAEGSIRVAQPVASGSEPLVPGAHRVTPQAEIPGALLGAGPPVVVVGRRESEVLRLAARLSRAGAPRVAAVTADGALLRQLARITTPTPGSGREPSATPGIQAPEPRP